MSTNSPWFLIYQIARVEMILRLRRFSTLIMILLLVIGGFFMVPDPSSGMTVISSNNQRVLYNSVAIAIGGSSLATLLISLAGYYLVSNSLSRDVRSRMGGILGATPVSSTTLIVGKWLGNSGYLGCLVLALIPGGMLVQLLRGEAPIQLLDYLSIYALMFIPQVMFVAAIALWFESERWLRGRFGDVLYFIIWCVLLSVTINVGETQAINSWQGMLDVTAMGFIVSQLIIAFGTSSVSIGLSDFDPELVPLVLHGIQWSDTYIRALAIVPAVLLLAVAVWRFHRYNPDMVKADAAGGGSSWWLWLNRRLQFLRVLIRPGWILVSVAPPPVARILADVLLTVSATPIWIAVLLMGYVVAALMPTATMANGLILCLSAGALATAELGSRDRQSGMWQVIAASPRLPERFLLWKLLSSITTILLFVAVTLWRLTWHAPEQALTLLIGVVFCAAASLAFAVLSKGGKIFAGSYLLLLYLTLNARKEPGFDFAGINGVATTETWLGYGIAALALLVIAQLSWRWQNR